MARMDASSSTTSTTAAPGSLCVETGIPAFDGRRGGDGTDGTGSRVEHFEFLDLF